MTDALDKLIEAVEAGTHAEDIHWRVYAAAVGVDLWDKAKSAANGSLDAAHALHKAVAPGWRVANIVEHPDCWEVLIAERDGPSTSYAKSETPGRALLLADLYALRAMKERSDG